MKVTVTLQLDVDEAGFAALERLFAPTVPMPIPIQLHTRHDLPPRHLGDGILVGVSGERVEVVHGTTRRRP